MSSLRSVAALLQALVFSVGSWGFGNVCNVGGVFFFFAGGRKKRNKFPSNLHCPVKKLNPFFVINYHYRICLVVCLYTCCQRLRLYAVRDCGLQTCPPTPKFGRGRMLELPLKPLLHIAFVSVLCIFINIYLSNNQYIFHFRCNTPF